MIKMSCPYCEKVRDIEVVTREEQLEDNEVEFRYKIQQCLCKTCNEVFETGEQMDTNLIAAREAYQVATETISPSEIKNIRLKYNASQKAFGLILGMGELTINSYEQGKSIPNTTNRLLLQLSQDPNVFLKMYNINKMKIGDIQRKRIESSTGFIMANS